MRGKEKKPPALLFEEQCARLAAQGYAVKDRTVGLLAANVYGILTALPFAAAGVLAFVFSPGAGVCVAACLTGYWALCALGVFGVVSAGADLFVSFRLLFAKGRYFLDHPERCGFFSFSR